MNSCRFNINKFSVNSKPLSILRDTHSGTHSVQLFPVPKRDKCLPWHPLGIFLRTRSALAPPYLLPPLCWSIAIQGVRPSLSLSIPSFRQSTPLKMLSFCFHISENSPIMSLKWSELTFISVLVLGCFTLRLFNLNCFLHFDNLRFRRLLLILSYRNLKTIR